MKQNKKYSDIIDAAQRLFHKYGIKKVTVEDICKESNVSKMTFYKFFPNKTELAKTMLTKILDTNIRMVQEMMVSDIPFTDKMNRLVQWKIDNSQDTDMQFVKDVYATSDADSEIAGFLRKAIKERQESYINELVKAQEKGWMRKDVKPALLLAMFDKMQEVTGDKRVLQAYDNVQELISEISRFFIYGIANER